MNYKILKDSPIICIKYSIKYHKHKLQNLLKRLINGNEILHYKQDVKFQVIYIKTDVNVPFIIADK